jgi:hypothetical protein
LFVKIIAALLLLVSLSANAAQGDQRVCAKMAEIGKSAATANAKGVSEWDALRMWQGTTGRANASEAVFEMGVVEIRAVYRSGDLFEGEGYWTAYDACMGAMQ